MLNNLIKKTPLVMGIVNVTPDSFSDGGKYNSTEKAIAHGLLLLEQGADILDVGGESTRPNSDVVSVEEENERVVPVIKGLAGKAPFISIDSRNAKTMAAAIDAGANMVNDVSALSHDPASIDVIAGSDVMICLMHMRGKPQNMQDAPAYGDVVDEILSFFEHRLELCQRRNIDIGRIILDPGIGFGKTLEHNLLIINSLSRFKKFGCPVLLGASRKSFIGDICNIDEPERRVSGSISAAIYGLSQGANIFRVHDVAQTRQAFDVYTAISRVK